MTREEAIRELKIFSGTTKTRLSANFWKALDMAIKVLEQEPCEDAISRQAAIDYFVTNVGFHDEDGYPIEETDELRKIWTEYFSGIPSAQPKRGRWIYCEDSMADCVDGYRCDQCGFFVPLDYKHKGIDFIQDYNFCPNCGADMRGEQDG